MADFLKDKTVQYLNRDFTGFKRDLIKFSQAHHSGVFQNINESSPGMAVLELCAYIGDNLSFYLDRSFDELKTSTARQEKNVVDLAKMLGYRPKGKRAARGDVYFMLEVPATTDGFGNKIPNEIYAPILRVGARAEGPNGVSFETLESITFSSSLDREVTGSRFDGTTGLPTHFAIRKPVECIAGQTKTDTVAITEFESFRTIELSESDVIEIISVTDSEGSEWYEVDYLAQDTVFSSDMNSSDDSESVPYILKIQSVPRRFITDRDPTNNKTSLIFGSGDGINFDDEIVPNLADLALPLAGRDVFTSVALDPQNFLKTRSLGLSPYGTTLTIKYRVGGGPETNVPPKTIRVVSDSVLDFTSTNLDPATRSDVEGSLECINLRETEGGAPAETIAEIKANSSAHFATQARVVTREDFITRVRSIPEKFGKPDKVMPKKNSVNPLAIDIHILARDANNNLQRATSNLKKNIATYLAPFRMMTDGINIMDADIINVRVNFGVVVAPKFNKSEVLTKCLSIVGDYLHVDNMEIGTPIVLTDLSSEIQEVLGVISVYELKILNVIGSVGGLNYSNVRFDTVAAVSNSIMYCPENSIFEVKYPRRDIVGAAK